MRTLATFAAWRRIVLWHHLVIAMLVAIGALAFGQGCPAESSQFFHRVGHIYLGHLHLLTSEALRGSLRFKLGSMTDAAFGIVRLCGDNSLGTLDALHVPSTADMISILFEIGIESPRVRRGI